MGTKRPDKSGLSFVFLMLFFLVLAAALQLCAALVAAPLPRVATSQRCHHSVSMLSISQAKPKDFGDVANFFIQSFFGDVKQGQAQQLEREQITDMTELYGGDLPRPSALFVAREGGRILGCVGVEAAVCQGDRVGLRARGAAAFAAAELRPLLSNLAVAPAARRRGVGRRLVARCEATARGWGYGELLLLVDSANAAAIRLYEKMGYELLFEDRMAMRVEVTPVQIRNARCTNLCLRKSLAPGSGGKVSGGGSPVFAEGLMARLFGR
ncbi:unnamed protein product [Phaeothamnion confervicola]